MKYVFSSKNFQENSHKNYPRDEVVYYREVKARSLLQNLKQLIDDLNTEVVAVQMKIINEKQFLETQFERFLKTLGTTADAIHRLKGTVQSEEKELKTLYDKIVKISTHLTFKSKSKEILKKTLSHLSKLLWKFPANHLNSNDRAPTDSEIGVKYITVRKLVEKTTEVVDTEIADKLKNVMILTYDHFMKPLSLLLMLTRRYYTPRPFMMTNEEYNLFKAHHSNTRRKRIIELLTFWVDSRENDFTIDSDLLALLVIFLESIFTFDKEQANHKDFLELYQKVEKLIEKSNHKMKKELIKPPIRRERVNTMELPRPRASFPSKKRHTTEIKMGEWQRKLKIEANCSDESYLMNEEDVFERPRRRLQTMLLSRVSSNQSSGSKSVGRADQELIMDWDTKEIAEQLTLIDMKAFEKIQINHFMRMRWAKPAYYRECSEIHDAINRFNSLSFWVQYVIINTTNSVQRTLLLNKFIAIAAECFKLKNFASSHSIFTAFLRLQNTSIWKVDEDNIQNWKLLENVFKSPMFFQDTENTLKTLSPPAVPSVPFFTNRFFRLQDNVSFLTKLEGNRKYLKSIQLAKLADYAMLIKKFQSQKYNFIKDVRMYKFLKEGYKNKIDIDFESETAEEILRLKIIDITAAEAKISH